MSKTGKFQDDVRKTLGSRFNFQLDSAHGGKPIHVDLTARMPRIGADKVEVDYDGNVIGGTTQIGRTQLKW